MVSPAVNVLRYSALATGIVYGVVHRQTLQAKFDADSARHELEKREQWLKQAKQAWQNQVTKNTGLITDPDAPGFDLEAVLKSLE